MTTITVTEVVSTQQPTSLPLQLVTNQLPLPTLAECETIIERLGIILNNHAERADPLSQELFKIGLKLLALSQEDLSLADITTKVRKHLDKLIHNTLTNPLSLTRAILVAPMLEREHWVWEKNILDAYLDQSKPSPYDNAIMDRQNIKIHSFAKEILALINSLPLAFFATQSTPVNTNFQPTSRDLVTFQVNGGLIDTSFALHKLCAMMENQRQISWQQRRDMKELTHRMVESREESEAYTARQIAEAENKAAIREENQRHRIESIQQTNQTNLDIINARLDANASQLDSARAINENNRIQLEEQQRSAAAQDKRIQALERQAMNNRQELAALQRKASKRKKCIIQ